MAKEFPDDATSAAVIGCGPVGLMAILAAQAQGAQKVHICLLCVGLSPVCWSVSCVLVCLLCDGLSPVCLSASYVLVCPLCVGLSHGWSVSCVLLCLLCVGLSPV